MKKHILLVVCAALFLSVSISAQTTTPATTTTTNSPAASAAQSETKPKRQVFRANKEQIMQAQKMLKATESGKMDDEFRTAIRKYQTENNLASTGTLNRATLEKMNIVLTDKQKEIPVSPSSLVSSDAKSGDAKKRGPVFRANKEQISEAQKMLKAKSMYAGEETGKLDDATRDGIRKFQAANNVKVTGTLNKETLEKMGIMLTDRQKEM